MTSLENSKLDGVKIEADWLEGAKLQTLFDILLVESAEALVNGGAVRNSLMGMAVKDVDIATTHLPQKVIELVENAGHKAIPTGIDHGTITVVIEGEAFEVTTLREDVETDGRHAVVKFGSDWQRDAERRDLTINALYCDRDGNVFDLVDGYDDLKTKTVRFIGEADQRINEDALRILRFFRFFAHYGDGRPDAEGLKASAKNKAMIEKLSVERVWAEFSKILAAPDPMRAVLWMRNTGILQQFLPESEKWGVDFLPGLIRLERELGWKVDPMLRLMTMMRPHMETVEAVASRLKLSNQESERLMDWAAAHDLPLEIETAEMIKQLYRGPQKGILNRMQLDCVAALQRSDDDRANLLADLIEFAQIWERPAFPVSGKDLIALGHEQGQEMGNKLRTLEEAWIESGFALTKAELLDSVR